MGFINGIWLIALGILAVPSLIIAKRPEAKDIIAKVAPYQGWFGVISTFWGAWIIISCLLAIGHIGILWITSLAAGIVLLCLGLLLGVGVMKSFSKSQSANEKLDSVINKIAPYQGTLGLIALGLGVWMIICTILYA